MKLCGEFWINTGSPICAGEDLEKTFELCDITVALHVMVCIMNSYQQQLLQENTMQTLTTNLCNGTGEEATVKFTKKGSFKFHGYSFSLSNIQTFNFESKVLEDGGCFDLIGEVWEDSLATIHFDGEPNIETMVRKAVIWVANYV